MTYFKYPGRLRIPLLILVVIVLSAAGLAQDSEVLYRKGNALIQALRYSEAEEVFKSITSGAAQYPAAQTLLGFLSLRQADLTKAEDAFEHVLQSQPDNAAAHFGLGLAFAQRGLPEDAAREYRQAFDDPWLGEKARVQWIQSLFGAGKEEEAFSETRNLVLRLPGAAAYQNLLGFFLQLRGRPKDAELAYERAVSLDPANLSSYLSLISICRVQKNWEGALQWIRKALVLDASQPLLYEELAKACEELGRLDEAKAAHVEGQRKLNAELLHIRATQARLAGRSGEAERALRECLKNNPRLAKAWVDLGEIFLRDQRLKESRQAYLKAIEIDPSNRPARLGLAAVLEAEQESAGSDSEGNAGAAQRGEDQAADDKSREMERIIKSLIREVPDNPDLLAYLGHMKESAGQSREALGAYSEALRVDPTHVAALEGKARYALAAGDRDQAISLFRRAVELEPSNAEAWRGLIQAQMKGKRAAEAENSCNDCLARNPGNFDCREMLAQLKLDSSDYKEAARQYQTVLRDGKASKDILDNLAFSLMQLGDTGQAVGLFQSSLKRYGPDAWVYASLGHLHRVRGEYQAAIADYRHARQLSPRDPEISHNLGFCLYLAKNYSAAVEPYESALRLRPDWGLAHFNLAMDYWNLKQYALALAHARAADERGVPGAHGVVETLSTHLAPSLPHSSSVYRPKR